MDKVQPYPKHILAMQTMEGFLDMYNRYHVAYNDAELAYDEQMISTKLILVNLNIQVLRCLGSVKMNI